MTVVVLNQGEQAFLQNGVTGVAYQLRLFKNDVTAGLTPTQIDALDETDFVEATFAGYSAAAVGTGDWTITVGDPTQAVNLEKSFVRSSTGTAQTIWGYYVTRTSDGLALWFEKYPAPVVVEFINDEVQATPLLTLDDRSGNVSVPIGGSILWSGPTSAIPPGFRLRDGSAVSRTTYSLLNALFAAAGYPFGNGDGSTTFNLPNQQQRVPIGVAASGPASALGATGGTFDHVHGLDTSSSGARIEMQTSGNNLRMDRKTISSYTTDVETTTGLTIVGTANAGQTLGAALTGSSDTANPPYLADYFIIRVL